MKGGLRHFGLFLVTVLMVFVLAGCPDPTKDDDNGSGGGGGANTGTSASDAIALTMGSWRTANIGLDTELWFTASVTAGSTYRVSWDDFDADGDYDVDLVFDAYRADGSTTYFTDSDYGDGSNADGTYYEDVTIASDENTLYVVADSTYYSDESGDFRVKIELISAGDDSSDDDSTDDETPAADDATLSSLAISAGTLAPSFAAATTSYSASVANSVESLTVTPTVNDSGATVTVNGTAVTSGSESTAISLSEGSNTITVVVTAEDETTSETYTLSVTRAVPAIGSWSQVGTAVASVGSVPPATSFDSDGNVYVAYVDSTSKDVGLKRSTDGSSWSALGGGVKEFFPLTVADASTPAIAVVGSGTSGTAYVGADVATSLFSMQSVYSVDLSSSTAWGGPYGTNMEDYDSDYTSWFYSGSAHVPKLFAHGDTLYVVYKNGSNLEILSNDGSSTDFAVALAAADSGVTFTTNFVMKDTDNMAVAGRSWGSNGYELSLYTGTMASGFSQVDTSAINGIFTDDGLMSLDIAYNPSNGNLGVVISDDGGLTRLYELNGSTFSQVGSDIFSADDRTTYAGVSLVYTSAGVPTVILRNGSTWTGGTRYNSSDQVWETIAAAPESGVTLYGAEYGGDTLYVTGIVSQEAKVWTFSAD